MSTTNHNWPRLRAKRNNGKEANYEEGNQTLTQTDYIHIHLKSDQGEAATYIAYVWSMHTFQGKQKGK